MSAVLSDCGRYRYALWRDLQPPLSADLPLGTVLFVMLNPSTADADVDDPTIRRCVGFAEAWGFDRLAVANLYAFRATNPDVLETIADPIGPANNAWLAELGAQAALCVAAWGAHRNATRERVAIATRLIDHDLKALRLTKGGRPEHPLYVPSNVELVDYRGPT